MLLSLLFSLAATAAPVNSASLGACPSRTLEIEVNVDGKTTKHELVEVIKLLADYPAFTIVPDHSEQSELRFLARLNSNCMSDSCARADGWFGLQKRLERFKGVAVSCQAELPPVGGAIPRLPAPGAPGRPPGEGPGFPPPPRDGGVVGGN